MVQCNISRRIVLFIFISLFFIACGNYANVIVKLYSVDGSYNEYPYDVLDTIINNHSHFDEKYHLSAIYNYQDFIQNGNGGIEIADNLWLNIIRRIMMDNQEIVYFSVLYKGVAGRNILYTKDYGIFYVSETEGYFKIRLKKIIKKGKEIDLTEINNFMDSTILKPPSVQPAPIIEDFE